MRIFLAAEALFTLGYFLLPPSGLKAASYAALGLSAVAALVVGARIYRPRQPLAWYLLAAGLFMLTAGDTINNGYEWVLQTEAPFPSSADVVYLAFFPLLAAGLLLLVRARTPGRDRTSLIDAVIIATGVGPAVVDLPDRPLRQGARPDDAAAAGLDRLPGPGRRAVGGGGAPVAGRQPEHGRLPAAHREPAGPAHRRHGVRPEPADCRLGPWRRPRPRLGRLLPQPGRGRAAPVDAVAVGAGRPADPPAHLAAAHPADRGDPDGAGHAGHPDGQAPADRRRASTPPARWCCSCC